MQTYMLNITRGDGTKVQRSGLYADGLAAAQIARATFPDATSIDAEPFARWLAAQQVRELPARHDTERLPRGGFYFAPGALDPEPGAKPRSAIAEMAIGGMKLLAVAGLLGCLAGYLQARGWPF